MRAPDGEVRPAYADFAGLLDDLSIESLVTKQVTAEELFRRLGITFAVYAEGGSTERLIPFGLIPRILDRAEWELVKRGCIQRVKAIRDAWGSALQKAFQETVPGPGWKL
jgi:uncharacterized circularly permuted ATP-grasp superfamily protein